MFLLKLATVPDLYYTAINSVLSKSLTSTIVVQSRNHAQFVIDYFSRNKIGVVTCLVIDELVHLMNKLLQQHERIPDLHAALSILQVSEHVKPAFVKLLSNWYIAPLSTVALSKQIAKNIVTLEGDLFYNGGAEIKTCAAFSNNNTSAMIIAPLNIPRASEVAAVKQLVNYNQHDEEQARREVKVIEEQAQKVQVTVEEAKIKLSTIEAELSSLQALLELKVEEAEQLKVKLVQENEEVASKEKRLEVTVKLHHEASKLLKTEHEELKEFEQLKTQLEEKLHATNAHSILCKISKIESLTSEIERLEQEVRKNKRSIKVEETRLENQQEELKQVAATITEEEQKLIELNSSATADEKELKAVTSSLNEAKKAEQETAQKVNAISKQIYAVKNEIKTLVAKRELVEEELKQCKNVKQVQQVEKLNQTRAKISQNTMFSEITFNKKQFNKMTPAEIEKQLQQELSDIKMQQADLDEWKKKVDVKHVEAEMKLAQEVKSVTRKAKKLEKQIFKNMQQKEQLQKQRFAEFNKSCTAVNEKMSAIFKSISPFSDCFLSYPNNERALMEEGVILQCKPDSFEWKSFEKLSGGQQALCSITLALALQQCFPSPLFLCDEIDASLDTQNIEKIAKVIQTVANQLQNQFICISLRHQMYEFANKLIGVYHFNHTSKTISKDFVQENLAKNIQ